MHTDKEIEQATARFERWAATLAGDDFEDTTDLRELAEAVDRVRTDEARVRELVARARAHSRSWGEIGIALGVSRQAARERFNDKAHV